MLVTVTTPPAVQPLTLSDCYGHLRIDDNNSDLWLTLAIDAVREYAERRCSRSFVTRQLQVEYFCDDPFPRDRRFVLPRGPVSALGQVLDQNGNVVSSSLCQLVRLGTTDYAKLPTGVWPPVIQYTAGFGTAETNVPSQLRLAMLMHLAHLWDNRSASTSRPMNHVFHGLDAIYGQAESELTL